MIVLSEHLTQKAWSKSKSLAMKFKSGIKIGATNLTPTLKAVEEAAKKDDHQALIRALQEVVEIARRNLSNKAVDDEARGQLQRIVEEGKKALPRIAEEAKKKGAAAAAPAAATIGSGSTIRVPLFSQKMAADLKMSELKALAPPDFSFKVEILLDGGVHKQLEKDGLLLQELNRMCQQNYETTVKAIRSKLKAFDGMIQKAIEQNRPKAEIEKLVDGLNKAFDEDKRVAETACENEAGRMWVELARKRSEYTRYQLKIVTTLVGAAATLTVSITLMAATPFSFGASTVPAILTMVKAATTIATELGSAALSVEQCQKVLAGQIAIVEAAKQKFGKPGMVINDATAAVVKEFIGISQPCIKSCQDQCGTMVSKLKGAEIRCHDLSKTLNGLLDKQELFRREFMAGVEKKAQASPSGKAKADVKEIERRLDARLAGNYEKVQTLLEKTSSAYRAFNQAAADAVLLQKRVAGLGDRPMLLKVLTGALVLKDLALTPLGANGLVQVSELATNIGPTAAGWGYDRLTEGVLDRTFLGAGA
jgi:hypothetical protein